MADQEKKAIHVDERKCVGCLTCQLYCSYRKSQSFNPAVANIKVDRMPQGYGHTILFGPGCDGCLLCVRNCLYGALIGIERETLHGSS
ncbi:MAG TPA: hypothetical protein VN462_02030 [Negativicutes bacterium]|nr:hypothetical protein [Negativicutes bacterium]